MSVPLFFMSMQLYTTILYCMTTFFIVWFSCGSGSDVSVSGVIKTRKMYCISMDL